MDHLFVIYFGAGIIKIVEGHPLTLLIQNVGLPEPLWMGDTTPTGILQCILNSREAVTRTRTRALTDDSESVAPPDPWNVISPDI